MAKALNHRLAESTRSSRTEGRSPRLTIRVASELRDLIPSFLSRRRTDLQTLKKALESRDYETILSIGHRMKGNGESMGFRAISEIGAALEEASSAEEDKAIEHQAKRLESYLERIDVVYE